MLPGLHLLWRGFACLAVVLYEASPPSASTHVAAWAKQECHGLQNWADILWKFWPVSGGFCGHLKRHEIANCHKFMHLRIYEHCRPTKMARPAARQFDWPRRLSFVSNQVQVQHQLAQNAGVASIINSYCLSQGISRHYCNSRRWVLQLTGLTAWGSSWRKVSSHTLTLAISRCEYDVEQIKQVALGSKHRLTSLVRYHSRMSYVATHSNFWHPHSHLTIGEVDGYTPPPPPPPPRPPRVCCTQRLP